MPFYDHECGNCNQIFEDFYSMVTPPPTVCPLCGKNGKVKRLISDSYAVRVPLMGIEKTIQMKKDAAKFSQLARTNEEVKANIAGEEAYNKIKTNQDKLTKEYKHKS